MLSSLATSISKGVAIKPFAGSLAEATQVRYRWYKDKLENRYRERERERSLSLLLLLRDIRQMKRVGFVDKVKQEGPLPRLKDDSKAIKETGNYRATNNWAEHRALHGQNDYIDILGGVGGH